ncbi:helicase-associated domain-containing protein [Paenibacillus soyae]|uniref:Helicase-associated domain-containing protein n=1 Tax=Paenibacillus soyae TaxID=2969249 RepID=A0A9X2MR66_9BACL|nr:helicase-associated domain-containing protein [Paenibacillus soyae]MCR2804900.1 helicase-associated domain-containing protein [Paenibacillus soyae]
MNTEQLTRMLPDERLRSFLRQDVWLHAAERGMSWQEAVKDREAAAIAINRLSAYASDTLKMIVLRFGAEPVAEEKLIQALRDYTRMAGAESRIGVKQLESAGFLFAVQKLWGEKIYWIPSDCYTVWQNALFPFALSPVISSARPLAGASGIREPFGRRILYLLAALAKGDASFTAKGLLSKKTAAKLDEALLLDESKLTVFPLDWANKDHYSLKTAFALTVSSELGLLRKEEGGLALHTERMEAWLALAEEARERELQDRLGGMLFRWVGADALFGSILMGASGGSWYSITEAEKLIAGLTDSMHERAMRGQVESAASRLGMSEWTHLFHELGWMELAEADVEGQAVQIFRWRAFPRENTPEDLIVQPNGEIWAPPGCGYAARWELELLGERVNAEEPLLYRLSAAAVSNALEQGRTKGDIERFLQTAGGGELSVHVRALLREWTGKACRFSFEEVTLLRCDSDEMAGHAKSLAELAPRLIEQIGERDFIVESSSVSEIRRLLQKSGYPPRKGIGGVKAAAASYPSFLSAHERAGAEEVRAEQDAISNERASWLLEPIVLRHYQLVQNAQDDPEVVLLPGIERVPAAWWREMRSYHASTRKEFMQQAVSLETAVQLRLNGEIRSFVPEQVEQRGQEWAVTGRMIAGDRPERSRLTPDMWEEMKLVLPSGIGS